VIVKEHHGPYYHESNKYYCTCDVYPAQAAGMPLHRPPPYIAAEGTVLFYMLLQTAKFLLHLLFKVNILFHGDAY
jgi:hypothetical protein